MKMYLKFNLILSHNIYYSYLYITLVNGGKNVPLIITIDTYIYENCYSIYFIVHSDI